ncbi:MAG: uridine kinase [Candidatus Woesearchaeota archaeon]
MIPKFDLPDSKNALAFEIVKKAVEKYKTNKPFIIGITGAGGAGKTTFGNNIMTYYGHKNCISIDLDDYLLSRYERGKLGITGYDPKANKLNQARENIIDLLNYKEISKPRYNHSNGNILENEIIEPKEIIVIEGVTTLYPQLVDLNNISFFLDALEETQIKSRIERDVNKRGYTQEEALILFNSVKPDYLKYIEPTKKFASIIFEVGTDYIMYPKHINPKFT